MERSTDKEYELLRDEISGWQNKRIGLVGVSVTVVTALIGFSQFANDRLSWDFIAFLLLLFLSITCGLSEYCGLANVKIGTYLQVFHEGVGSSFNWGNRNLIFSKVGLKSGNLNQLSMLSISGASRNLGIGSAFHVQVLRQASCVVYC